MVNLIFEPEKLLFLFSIHSLSKKSKIKRERKTQNQLAL